LCPAILNREVATVDPSEFAEPLYKSGNPLAVYRRRGDAQEPDGRQFAWLLRPRRERPCRRAAKQRDELATPNHSITSSARARKDSGIVRLMALAAGRLMINSNLVGCSIGRSAALAPLKILST